MQRSTTHAYGCALSGGALGEPRLEPVERRLEPLRHLAPAEQADDDPAQRRGGLLRAVQPQPARTGAGRLERHRERRRRGEAGCRLAVEALGFVAPCEPARRIMLDDDLVDLRPLATPVAVHALAPPDAV